MSRTMTINELNDEFIKMCNEQEHCRECKYEGNLPCQLIFGYDKGRADVLEEIKRAMYHEVFEVSHEKDNLQKWDSGNWIRYKLFENVIKQLKEQNNENI